MLTTAIMAPVRSIIGLSDRGYGARNERCNNHGNEGVIHP
jgi:hypothetical protein